MFSAAALPDGATEGDRRPVRTSLRRGPRPAVMVCGACGNWLAVGYRPDDRDVLDLLLACSACHRVNDPHRATPLEIAAVPDGLAPPAELSVAEVWAKAAVERVHALAAQERRWPWRAERA
jgi:hypothetical protein